MFMAFFFKASSIPTLIFLLLSCNLIRISETQTPAPAPGLSYDFYRTTCPRLETIIRQNLQSVFASDIGQAAGLLRLHFHDCFVQDSDFLKLSRALNALYRVEKLRSTPDTK
ncbi:putative peroxidase [Helianthus annuus]|nr:putative peroxidase [Helianthus annuus]